MQQTNNNLLFAQFPLNAVKDLNFLKTNNQYIQ